MAASASLAQIIGIEQGVRGSAEPWWKSTRVPLTKDALQVGTSERYEPLEGNVPLPDRSAQVQVNVTLVLREFREKIGRYLDVTATKDWGNIGEGGARADVVIDGHVIVEDAPATYLLFLEKRLAEFQADFQKIPAQSMAEQWVPSTEEGIWRTEPVKRPQMKKDTAFEVPVGPTEFHRAEVREVTRDVVAGWWTQSYFTSSLPARQLRDLQDRLARLREAVQFAIHEANRITVPDVKVSPQIMGYLFDGTTP